VIDTFHFLRPWWLALLVAPVFVFVAQQVLDRLAPRADNLIAPHLLRFLLVPRGRSVGFRPSHFTMAALAVGAVAMAGPAWQYEQTPFTKDESPLIVALDLSQTMDAVDVEPTRLERGKQKIRDLLALRSHAKTALIAYAGTAHLVLPLTEDPGVGTLYLEALSTSLMPKAGNNPAAALALARTLLQRETVPASVLFVTDAIPRDQIGAFTDFAKGNDGVMVLGIGTDAGGPIRTGQNQFLTRAGQTIVAPFDSESLRMVAREAGAYVGTVTVDSTDVNRLQQRAQTQIARVGDQSGAVRWKDEGISLVPVVALLTLLSFRRGWTMQWAAMLLLAVWPASARAQAMVNSTAQPQAAPPSAPGRLLQWRFIDLWLTADQQGRYAFDRGDYKEASALFQDPEWKGLACYRAGDYSCAVNQFVRVRTADASYNLGNAYVHLKSWEQAADAYRAALGERPDFADARINLALVLDVIHTIEEIKKGQETEGTDQKPDDVQFDEKGKKGKTRMMERQTLKQTSTDVWLRGLVTSPAKFLEMKFAIQAEESGVVPKK
jgi:Ca-activated chloride channel homolog